MSFKYKVGDKVRIGGSKGLVGIVTKFVGPFIHICSFDGNLEGSFQIGDCSIIPFKDYEQLSLFE